MALRKTFNGLKVREDYKSLTVQLEDIRFCYGPGRSNCELTKWLDIMWENTKISNLTGLNHRYPNYFLVDELLEILPEVLTFMSLHKRYRETDDKSSCEVCPRFDLSKNKGFGPEFTVMVRYYEPEDIQIYERCLRTVFTIESVENDG